MSAVNIIQRTLFVCFVYDLAIHLQLISQFDDFVLVYFHKNQLIICPTTNRQNRSTQMLAASCYHYCTHSLQYSANLRKKRRFSTFCLTQTHHTHPRNVNHHSSKSLYHLSLATRNLSSSLRQSIISPSKPVARPLHPISTFFNLSSASRQSIISLSKPVKHIGSQLTTFDLLVHIV